jgi:hypothetical protein
MNLLESIQLANKCKYFLQCKKNETLKMPLNNEYI